MTFLISSANLYLERYKFNTNNKFYFILLSYNPDILNKFKDYIKSINLC